ncbi:MAG: Glutamine synthetase [Parcubacteria group bacterium GW2011_GWA2_44_12]|nr:MAG: Glutamine synthetase [Parcubacteria group bacterium GW2011_GWA2_44_12]
MKPQEVLSFIANQGIKIVDMRFSDLFGTWQHFSVSAKEFSESVFEKGLGFDGSSLRAFKDIQESDMIVVPDPTTAFLDPFTQLPTLVLICHIKDPISGEMYTKDPRYIAKKAELYLKSSGIADMSYWGPEAEFFIFNHVRFDQLPNCGYYFVDSSEGIWHSGADVDQFNETGFNLAHRPGYKGGYFPVPPVDSLQDIRSEMVDLMENAGIAVEVHHHEVGTSGQSEIDLRFSSLAKMADQMMIYKYIVKNVARKHGMTATFMPKPLFEDNGSGMHTHQSLWKGEKNLFFDKSGYAGLSEMAKYYIGGILKHARALCALIAPTTNSYKRLVPGYEAPVKLAYSARNRSAAIRIPMYSMEEKAKRIEFRTPDPSCNPYIAFSAMLLAGLDGVMNKLDPGSPLDKDLYHLNFEEDSKVKSVPGSLEEALFALEDDHTFLLAGDVFTKDVISAWTAYKRLHEVDQMRLRPHPYEFSLYYSV